jgi:hypothetical protein
VGTGVGCGWEETKGGTGARTEMICLCLSSSAVTERVERPARDFDTGGEGE